MERNYGVQSYHPRKLDLRYWGEGPNHYYGAAGTLLKQNILFACYNDALTAEQQGDQETEHSGRRKSHQSA